MNEIVKHNPMRPRLMMEPELFGGSCLPRTMEFARSARRTIEARLHGIHQDWPFEDRVLVWLLPILRKDVETFHENKGRIMTEIFQPQHLAHFDEVLTRDLLTKVPFYYNGHRLRSLK